MPIQAFRPERFRTYGMLMNPLLFHVTKSSGVKTSRLESTGEIVHAFLVNAPFVGSVSSYRAQRQRVERAAAIAMKTIVGVTNVVEKVKRLHDYLSANCQYSVVGYGSKTMKYRTVYDALVCGQAVCEGFTIAFRRCKKITFTLCAFAELSPCYNPRHGRRTLPPVTIRSHRYRKVLLAS